MSRESDFATRMLADATLMAILTGGIYQRGAVGLEGISRQTTPTAFAANGLLRPCALVGERDSNPDNIVRDPVTGHTSAATVVDIYLYEDSGYTSIDAALGRLFALFQGHTFSDSFELVWIGTINRERDQGALLNKSLARQSWLVSDIVG